jgi:hypothetical protein
VGFVRLVFLYTLFRERLSTIEVRFTDFPFSISVEQVLHFKVELAYWLNGKGQDVVLIAESWYRIFDGSGQRHEINRQTCKLVEEGFV